MYYNPAAWAVTDVIALGLIGLAVAVLAGVVVMGWGR